MPRLEDKICSLCAKALVTEDDKELSLLLGELRKALHLHIERLRGRLLVYPLVVERRKQNGIPPPDLPTHPNARSDQSPHTRWK
jgi:hypothetical protein